VTKLLCDCGDKLSVDTLCSNGIRKREITKDRKIVGGFDVTASFYVETN
jgi:hypothetical protein